MTKAIIFSLFALMLFCKNENVNNKCESIKVVELARLALDKAFKNISLGKKVDGYPAQSNDLIQFEIPKYPLCRSYQLKECRSYHDSMNENWYVYFHCPNVANSEVSVHIYRWSEIIMKGLPYPHDYKVSEVIFGKMKYRNMDGSICQNEFIECMYKMEDEAKKVK